MPFQFELLLESSRYLDVEISGLLYSMTPLACTRVVEL